MDINREIAEKVMEWHFTEGWADWSDSQGNLTGWTWFENRPEDYFNPSTRIDHAWMVVEKLLKNHWYLRLGVNGTTDKLMWYADFVSKGRQYVQKGAATAPMAICLAALEAMKEQP